MKYLVVSDTHGFTSRLLDIVDRHPDIDRLLFLGDGYTDFSALSAHAPHLITVGVKGNCDPHLCPLPPLRILEVEKRRILLLHGHNHGVKTSLLSLKYAAKEMGADIVLFGHTHAFYREEIDGMYFFNPGSLSAAPDRYAILDITENSVDFSVP